MPADPAGDLAQMPFGELLFVFGTWRSRLVPPRPRQVHESSALAANAKRKEYAAALEAIIEKIRGGGDLKPHLSRQINFPHIAEADRTRQPLHRRKDRDLLIADWGVHHLHLSTIVDADGFVKRTGDLLFAAFTADDAYLINIYPHGNWGLREIVEIYVREWPNAGTIRPMHGITLAEHPTEKDALELRNAGVAGLLEIDGTVYMPPSQTTAGTPLPVTLRVQNLLHIIDELRERETQTDFESELDAQRGFRSRGDWSPLIHDGQCGFTREGVFVPVAPLP
jgi:hypothetical protein